MVVNISEAARMASKTRRTIYKHINQGKLSTTRDSKGNKGVEVSELIRVYGDDVKPFNEKKRSDGIQGGYTDVSSLQKLDLLLKKIERLEGEVSRLNETVENLNNRLEYKPVPTDAAKPPAQIKPNNEISSLMAKIKAKQVKNKGANS